MLGECRRRLDSSSWYSDRLASPMNVLQTITLSVLVRSRSTQGVRNSHNKELASIQRRERFQRAVPRDAEGL